ncbi:hypothetical protein PoB_001152200 [Plakobranchus ocellatus]|uniref:Uncharacterized protein n=1 Tax=Plakobranchus ocellatus TaxID=259542 RepID=A0AAV3YRA2_9GAST|nr:hypothetical protein PoB_001152200 [Plakobranchus ocellatus]
MNSHGHRVDLLHYDEWKTKVIGKLSENNNAGHPSAKLMQQVIESCAKVIGKLSENNNAGHPSAKLMQQVIESCAK